MACERPVVVSRRGGLEEVVDDGKSGLTFNYGDVGELSSSIIKILQDVGLASSMGRYGRKRVERDFTWNSVAKRIGLVYDHVLPYDRQTVHK